MLSFRAPRGARGSNPRGSCSDSPPQRAFSIKAGAAADLRAYSAFKTEDELILPPGTMFEVLNVKRISRSASLSPPAPVLWR